MTCLAPNHMAHEAAGLDMNPGLCGRRILSAATPPTKLHLKPPMSDRGQTFATFCKTLANIKLTDSLH